MQSKNIFPLYMVYSPIGGFGNHLRWLMLTNHRYEFTLKGINLRTPSEKLDFIKNHVYCNSRNWANWLEYEHTYRDLLNTSIKFTHDITDMFDGLKTVSLKVDPEFAMRRYIKFNPSIITALDTQLKQVKKQSELAAYIHERSPYDFLCVDSETLYNETLDLGLYTQCINFFAMESDYEIAQEIHKLWFKLHELAESEFVDYCTKTNKLTPELKTIYNIQ